MNCAHCGKGILTKQEFIKELEKQGIGVDPNNVDRYSSSGVSSGFGAYESAMSGIEAKYNATQKKRAFKCRTCGSGFCMECLLKHAPSHPNGGKACAKCGGAFAEA
jgi:hypothetical protein